MTEIEINPEYASFKEFGKITMCCDWMLYLFESGHLRTHYKTFERNARTLIKITRLDFVINDKDYFTLKHCPNCGVSIKVEDRREDKMIESTDYNL